MSKVTFSGNIKPGATIRDYTLSVYAPVISGINFETYQKKKNLGEMTICLDPKLVKPGESVIKFINVTPEQYEAFNALHEKALAEHIQLVRLTNPAQIIGVISIPRPENTHPDNQHITVSADTIDGLAHNPKDNTLKITFHADRMTDLPQIMIFHGVSKEESQMLRREFIVARQQNLAPFYEIGTVSVAISAAEIDELQQYL